MIIIHVEEIFHKPIHVSTTELQFIFNHIFWLSLHVLTITQYKTQTQRKSSSQEPKTIICIIYFGCLVIREKFIECKHLNFLSQQNPSTLSVYYYSIVHVMQPSKVIHAMIKHWLAGNEYFQNDNNSDMTFLHLTTKCLFKFSNTKR